MKNIKLVLVLFGILNFGTGFAQKNLDNKTKSTDIDLMDKIHLVAKLSGDQISVEDEVQIEYRLYVSHDVGISNWETIEEPIYNGFTQKDTKIENLKVESVTYKGTPYRMVILKKDTLKANNKGDFKFKPLQLKITAEIPDKKNTREGFNLSMKQVALTIVSNTLKINVKP